jgi:hypothetical protein
VPSLPAAARHRALPARSSTWGSNQMPLKCAYTGTQPSFATNHAVQKDRSQRGRLVDQCGLWLDGGHRASPVTPPRIANVDSLVAADAIKTWDNSLAQPLSLQGPLHADLGIAMDMSIQLKVPSGAILTLSLSLPRPRGGGDNKPVYSRHLR